MRILALDPAANTGFAFSSTRDRVEASGVWVITDSRDSHPGLRLRRLEDFILDQHAATPFEVIAYEKATFGSHNPAVKELHAELAGVIRLAAAKLFVPAWGYPIQTWKSRAIGNGGADKQQVIRALATLFGIRAVSEDQADAIGVLLAAQIGPPNEPKRAQQRRQKKARRREPKLF